MLNRFTKQQVSGEGQAMEEKGETYPICRVGSQSMALDWAGCTEYAFPATAASDSHEP